MTTARPGGATLGGVRPTGDELAAGRRGVIGRLDARVRRRAAEVTGRAPSWLPLRVLRRFALIDGRGRTLILAGQAFMALVPLLLVIASIGTHPHEQSPLAASLVRRFRLEGQPATAVYTLFSRPPGAASGLGLVGFVLLLFSLLSLARIMQNTFESAWAMPSAGLRRTVYSLSGTAVLLAELLGLTLLASALHALAGSPVTGLLIRVAGSVVFWMFLQWVLLSRRVRWRPLVPGAIIGGIGQVVISVFSATWMPSLIARNSLRYGIIGVALALLTWLIVIAGAIVAGAVTGAELAGRPLPGQLAAAGPAAPAGPARPAPRPADEPAAETRNDEPVRGGGPGARCAPSARRPAAPEDAVRGGGPGSSSRPGRRAHAHA